MKKTTYLFLILIILLACFLRFYNLTNKGIFLTDEGNYLQETQFVVSGIQSIFNKEDLQKTRIQTKGIALRHSKPTHTLLISALALWEGKVNEYVAFINSAIFGVLTVILLFLIAKNIFNKEIALLSALILALSQYHVMYSREGLAEVDSVFFFLFSFFFYLKSCKDDTKYKLLFLAISGLLAGIAYTCNYRLFLIPVFLWIYEIVYFFKKPPLLYRDLINRILILNLCMVLPILLFEVPYHLALLVFRRNNGVLPFLTYFEQLFEHLFFYGSKSNLNFNDILTYPYLIWHLEGPIITLLLIIGLIFLFIKINLHKFYILLQFLLPFIFFSLFEENNARHLAISLPAMALTSGYGLYHLNQSLKKNIDKIIILLILGIGIYNCSHLLYLKSGFNEAYQFLKDKKHLSTHWWVSTFYVDHKLVADFRKVKTKEELRRFYHQGYDYLLVDIMKYFSHPWPNWLGEKSQLLVDIETKCQPLYTTFDNRGTHLQVWFEHNISFKKTKEYFNNVPWKEKNYIKIYDLKEYFSGEKID
ncbi:glycosyltransferase family 39 protein [bacterium]|nr:glycosyltransferase family 39 protein [bacterium]